MKAMLKKFIKDWNNGAVIGESYIIVDMDCKPVEGVYILDVPRYDMCEAADRANELGGYVFHIVDAINIALEK